MSANASLDPLISGTQYPTTFYRSRDDTCYFAFGFLDGFGVATNFVTFNNELYRLPATQEDGQNFELVYVTGVIPRGRAWSTGVRTAL